MDTLELAKKVRDLRELQVLIEEAQAEAESIKDALKAHMGDCETLYIDRYKVTWKTVKSVRIDTAALKRTMPEVAERFTKITNVKRFTIA